MYAVIYDNEGKIDVDYIFKTYEEAREYVEKIISNRNDLFQDDEDVVVFNNDDALYISKVSLCKDVTKCK
jgi:lipopolysaccharide biosynthesis protein